MDDQIYQLIQTGIIAGAGAVAVVGSACYVANTWLKGRRSAHANAEAIGSAGAAKLNAQNDLEQNRFDRIATMLASDDYKAYTQRREAIAKEMKY